MRLETRDGQPLDISPLLHAFIGERTRDGYGEIMAYPALDCCYRAAEQKPPEKYRLSHPSTFRTVSISTNLIHRVLGMRMQRRISSLAVADRRDAQIADIRVIPTKEQYGTAYIQTEQEQTKKRQKSYKTLS